MATLRFKKDGTPFVDFRHMGVRYRPEFISAKDAKKFATLADSNPHEAYALWIESQQPQAPEQGDGFVSLKERIDAFKVNYAPKRANAQSLLRPLDRFFDYVTENNRLSDRDARSITFEEFEGFQNLLSRKGLRKAGLTNASVNREFSVIKTFFQRLFKARIIPINFAIMVDNLTVKTKQRAPWIGASTPVLIDRLVATGADQVLIDIAESNLWTPFGPTDYSRLKWKALNFKTNEINTYRLKGKGEREWDVPMLPEYRKLLLAIKKRQEKLGYGGPDDYVYVMPDFSPIKPVWVSKSLERHLKALGIKEVSYSSRHRIITAVADKTDRDTASKFAGHASIRTTEKHYLVGGKEDFRKRIAKAFRAARAQDGHRKGH